MDPGVGTGADVCLGVAAGAKGRPIVVPELAKPDVAADAVELVRRDTGADVASDAKASADVCAGLVEDEVDDVDATDVGSTDVGAAKAVECGDVVPTVGRSNVTTSGCRESIASASLTIRSTIWTIRSGCIAIARLYSASILPSRSLRTSAFSLWMRRWTWVMGKLVRGLECILQTGPYLKVRRRKIDGNSSKKDRKNTICTSPSIMGPPVLNRIKYSRTNLQISRATMIDNINQQSVLSYSITDA